MKLNLRPKNCTQANKWTPYWVQITLAFPIQLLIIVSLTCVQISPISTSQELLVKNQSSLTAPQAKRDVKDFHLTSDFRAVKLRWSYEQSVAYQPASFAVRYCELTSWNIEIKCRRRDMRVERHHQQVACASNQAAKQTLQQPDAADCNAVINNKEKPTDTVYQLGTLNGFHSYETQIFDLRALTNYTFNVQVSRFSHESEQQVNNQQVDLSQSQANKADQGSSSSSRRGNRGQAARRLSLTASDVNSGDSLSGRVETKPFNAEATKCLADVSEVLINTGRYFGGRISVEDSTDPRCNLLGNKSSEQTSYLFRIDHEVCGSKIVDGNRIETMILVHENKDILTHNTARFLVLCNFLQKSFTLRASISLPKVNGIVAAHTRPAVITSLPRPTNATGNLDAVNSPDEHHQQAAMSVLLGSMPGFYRARTVGFQQANDTAANGKAVDANGTLSSYSPLDEQLETNTIEKVSRSSEKSSRVEGHQTVNRQSKELNSLASARSLTLNADQLEPSNRLTGVAPQPVQVQSKVLLVERADPTRVGRQHNGNKLIHQTANLLHRPTARIDTRILQTESARNSSKQSAAKNLKSEDSSTDSPSIIMTNNHRVSGDYLHVASAKGNNADNSNISNNNSYSIKYSAAKIDEYSVGQHDDVPLVELNASQMRTRSGRMRSVESDQDPVRPSDSITDKHAAAAAPSPTKHQADSFWTVDNRMGEMSTDNGDLVAETSNEMVNKQPMIGNSTLAQNITSYLLKWSLKTLTNLARKSLESLAKSGTDNDTEVPVSSLDVDQPINEGLPVRPAEQESRTEPQHQQVRPHQLPKRISIDTTTTTTTKRPLPLTSEPQQNQSSQQVIGSHVSSVKPHLNKEIVSQDDDLLDGFLTSSSKRPEEKSTKSNQTLSNPEPVHSKTQQSRPSNYSKSLDFSRGERHKNSDRGKLNASFRHRPTLSESSASQLDQTKQSMQLNEGSWTSREAFYLSWPFYAILLLAALIVGVFLTFWLVSSPVCFSARCNQLNSEPQIHPITFNDSNFPTIVFNDTSEISTTNTIRDRSLRDESYQRYDYNKFENFTNDAINNNNNNKNNLLTTGRMSRPNQQSPSASSQCTRSTSAGSTLMVDENDCKNNEFLYTEHVLINTGSSSGESYA